MRAYITRFQLQIYGRPLDWDLKLYHPASNYEALRLLFRVSKIGVDVQKLLEGRSEKTSFALGDHIGLPNRVNY